MANGKRLPCMAVRRLFEPHIANQHLDQMANNHSLVSDPGRFQPDNGEDAVSISHLPANVNLFSSRLERDVRNQTDPTDQTDRSDQEPLPRLPFDRFANQLDRRIGPQFDDLLSPLNGLLDRRKINSVDAKLTSRDPLFHAD